MTELEYIIKKEVDEWNIEGTTCGYSEKDYNVLLKKHTENIMRGFEVEAQKLQEELNQKIKDIKIEMMKEINPFLIDRDVHISEAKQQYEDAIKTAKATQATRISFLEERYKKNTEIFFKRIDDDTQTISADILKRSDQLHILLKNGRAQLKKSMREAVKG